MSGDPSPGDREVPVDEWLKRLGKSDARPSAAKDEVFSAVLRRAAAREVEAVARAGLDSPEAEERALQQLKFRLRREGVDFRAAQPRRWWTASAAALLAVTVTVHQLMQEPADTWDTYEREAPSMRGNGASERAVKDPRADARKLARKLHDAGLRPIVYVQPERVTVSFALEAEQVTGIEQAVLRPLSLSGAREGENQVIFNKVKP